MEKFTNASVVSQSESEEVDLLAGPNISILPGLQSSKLTKRRQPNTTSTEKQGKFDVEVIAEVEYSLSKNEGDQTTLLQYELTSPVIGRLGGL